MQQLFDVFDSLRQVGDVVTRGGVVLVGRGQVVQVLPELVQLVLLCDGGLLHLVRLLGPLGVRVLQERVGLLQTNDLGVLFGVVRLQQGDVLLVRVLNRG